MSWAITNQISAAKSDTRHRRSVHWWIKAKIGDWWRQKACAHALGRRAERMFCAVAD